MKTILVYISSIFTAELVHCQDYQVFQKDGFSWNNFEIKQDLTDNEKSDLLKSKLKGVDYITDFYIKNNSTIKTLHNYHFIDINADGYYDILYSGLGMSEA